VGLLGRGGKGLVFGDVAGKKKSKFSSHNSRKKGKEVRDRNGGGLKLGKNIL